MKLPEEANSYNLTQNTTENVNSISRLICKKQQNVVSINGLIRVSAISASTISAIFQNLPNELVPNDLIEGIAYGISSADTYRIYINTDKSIYIYSPGAEIVENRQISFMLNYII